MPLKTCSIAPAIDSSSRWSLSFRPCTQVPFACRSALLSIAAMVVAFMIPKF
jgi:hypothetical protein